MKKHLEESLRKKKVVFSSSSYQMIVYIFTVIDKFVANLPLSYGLNRSGMVTHHPVSHKSEVIMQEIYAAMCIRTVI